MNFLTELSMSLGGATYKRLVTGEDCQVVAKQAIKQLLEQTMEAELDRRIRNHWKRHGRGSDRRNGYYERALMTSWGYISGIRVPRGRVNSAADTVIPRYERRQAEFNAAVAASFVLGHSTRKSQRFFQQFLGESGLSHSQVSRILSRVDESAQAWRKRALNLPYVYLWLDGKCAAIAGARKRPYSVLWAYGATEDGHRELLGFQIHTSEGTMHWESLLIELLDRGLDPKALKLVVRDENSPCEQAILSLLGDVPQQSCAVHLERNLGRMVGKDSKKLFQSQLAEVFKAPSLRGARGRLKELLEGWEEREPDACVHLRSVVDRSLVFYQMAHTPQLQAHLKSTNILERFFRELKRFEKSRQFRFADGRSCQRFYYLFAHDYNTRHPRMPRWPKGDKTNLRRLTTNASSRTGGESLISSLTQTC